MKKLMVLLISFSMVIVLTACNSDKETSEEQTDSNGKTKMTVFMPESNTVDLETNSFTKFAEEEFGINFEFETTSMDGAAAKERRQISLASGDYPDVYFLTEWVDQFKANDLLKYGKQGVLIPLNDLIEEHAPNLQKVLEEHEEFRKITVAPDGNIYGIPQLEECFHCTWPNKMWINTDWLEKLDLSIPETHEEFKNVLTAFNEQDPNGNGKSDEIPLSGSIALPQHSIIPFLMNGFIYDDVDSKLMVQDGKVEFVANKVEWKEGLTYIRSLYEEGLIDPGAFTQNQDAYLQLGNNTEMLLGAATSIHHGSLRITRINMPMIL